LNILLFSQDPIALDATVCRLIDLKPEYVPTIRFGMEFGAGTYRESEIELVGDNLNGFKPLSFKVERTPVKPFEMKGIRRLINNRLVPKPFINTGQCTQCGVCVSVCPATPKAVTWFDGDKSKPPVYQYNNCIRCYCCQEMCPEGAISLKVPLMRKVFNFFM
jgi:formate hydrogenlyase subunit 6/NADH:ubiquinone oxidoreductase subunit I